MSQSVVWTPHQVEFVSDLDQPELGLSAWAGHRWFAYDLVRWLQPRRVVELGSFTGCSFFAMAQAVQDGSIDAELLAVGAWKSSEDGSIDGDEVFEAFSSMIERRFSTLHTRTQRSNFEDALSLVDDGSIDLLHLEGLHRFETVKHDYQTWLPKLAEQGVVLIHGVSPSTGSGPSQLWHELSERLPGFAFFHGQGLGVLLPHSGSGRDGLLELGQSPWRTYYDHRAAHDFFRRQTADLLRSVAEKDESLVGAKKLVGLRDRELAAAEALLSDRDQALETSQASIAAAAEELTRSRHLLATRESELAETRQTLERRERELSLAAAGHQDLQRELTKLTDQRDRLAEERDRLAGERNQASARADQFEQHLTIITEDRDAQAERLEAYRRALGPVRWASRPGRKLFRRLAGRSRPELITGGGSGSVPAARLLGDERSGRARPVVTVGGDDANERTVSDGAAKAQTTDDKAQTTDDKAVDTTSTSRVSLEADGGALLPSLDEAIATVAVRGLKEGADPGDELAGVDRTTDSGVVDRDRSPIEPEPKPELLDADWYRSQYLDSEGDDRDPVAHWRDTGWRQNHDPSPLFSTSFYRNRYARRILDDQNPLDHYLDIGLAQGLYTREEHEETVLHDRALTPRPDELLTDITLQTPAGNRRAIPASALDDLNGDLVSFDLWDTTLVRTRPADAAKLATARRIRVALGLRPGESPSSWQLVERREEIETSIAGPNDGEFLLDDVLAQHLGELVAPGRYDVPALAKALERAELEDEKAASVPVAEVLAAIERLLVRDDKPTVAIVSEFHFASRELRELLASHGLTDDRLKVVASGDAGLSTPGKGALFEWVRRHTGVEADRHIHVGDDANTDVAMQNVTGGTAVHLRHGKRRYPVAGRLADEFPAIIDELKVELDRAGRLRCQQQAGNLARIENRLILAGWRTALLPVALVAAAIEDGTSHGVDRINYLGRSGLFLARVHEAVSNILVPELPTTAVQIDVSELSTFGPSLHEISPSSLLHLWRSHPRQTPRQLLHSLGADPNDFASEIRHHDLDLDEVIGGIHLDERIRTFIEDTSITWRLRQINEDRRSGLLGYLSKRIDLEARHLFLVDTQWRGAVQDNLARLLPSTRLVGWYPALFPYQNTQGDNVEKLAVGPDANRDQSVSAFTPYEALERVWTATTPAVTGYKTSVGAGGRPEPLFGEQALAPHTREAITTYQNAVVEAAPMVARWIVTNGASTDVLTSHLKGEFAAFFEHPEPGVADICFDSVLDTNFGTPANIGFDGPRPDRSWLAQGAGQEFRDRLDEAAAASLWPAGYRRWHPVEAATALERGLRANRFEPR